MGEVLIQGHRRYFGEAPNLARLGVAWAHCALEHAAGAKVYNFNLGNVTCSPAWSGDFYVMHVPPPDPPILRFRAFDTPELGALDYWRMLAGHYRPALRLFDEGRAFDAAIALGELGYYTASRSAYSGGVSNWKGWFDRNLSAAFASELANGRGNSLLSDDEIREALGSIEPKDGRRIEDQILPNERPTDPDLSTVPSEDPTGEPS